MGAVSICCGADCLGADMAELSAGDGADRFLKQIFEVLAVYFSRSERSGARVGPTPGAQPLQEMGGLVGQSAHLSRRHVEKVLIE